MHEKKYGCQPVTAPDPKGVVTLGSGALVFDLN